VSTEFQEQATLEPDPFHISDKVMIKKYRWSAH
jgi:hypothetical protein